jgi:hypothetical protein
VVVVVGLGASVATFVRAPWDAYALADPPLPAFIAPEVDAVGEFRVLVLVAQEDGTVTWDLTGAAGPTMASFGVPERTSAVGAVRDVIDDILGGSDPGAAGRLGVANVRYVVVPPLPRRRLAAARRRRGRRHGHRGQSPR